MATRKTRMNTDSPTSTTSGSEATTPSTPTTAVQKRITRKMLDVKVEADGTADHLSPVRKQRSLIKTASRDDLPGPLTASQKSSSVGHTDTDDADGGQSVKMESASDSGSTLADTDNGGEEPDKSDNDTEPDRDATVHKPRRNARHSIGGGSEVPQRVSTGRVGRPPSRKTLSSLALKRDLLHSRRTSSGRAELNRQATTVPAADAKSPMTTRLTRTRQSTTLNVPPVASNPVGRPARKRGRVAVKREEEETAATADEDEAEDEELDDDEDDVKPTKLIKSEPAHDDDVTADSEPLVDEMDTPKSEDDDERLRGRSHSVSDTSSNMDVPLQRIKNEHASPKAEPPAKDEQDDEDDEEDDASPVAAATGRRTATPLNDDSGIVVSKTPSPLTTTRPKRAARAKADDAMSTSSNRSSVDQERAVSPKSDAIAVQGPLDDCDANSRRKSTSPAVDQMDAEETAESPSNDAHKPDVHRPGTPSSTKSLSPVPSASEGVSPISVKAFYGRADFLENNLGIEKDPKLGDIVQKKGDSAAKLEVQKVRTEKSDAVDMDVNADEELIDEPLHMEESVEEYKPDLTNGTTAELKTEDSKPDNALKDDVDSAATDSKAIKAKSDTNDPDDKENVTLFAVKTQPSPNRSPLSKPCGQPDVVAISKSLVPESPESFRRKESHFLKLGLLTHEAAVAAKLEQERQREALHASNAAAAGNAIASTSGGAALGGKGKKPAPGSEYTGTLKTVIKLHRPSTSGEPSAVVAKKKPGRQPGALKMTLHKGRGKASGTGSNSGSGGSASGASGGGGSGNHSDHSAAGSAAGDEDTYYTIQHEAGDGHNDAAVHGGHSRKAPYRSHAIADASDSAEPKEAETALVIPEKASSFRIHPDKLCQDQCFYCGGKFGLFDTPCHVAAIKSVERQRKILDNEEKLTVDNCLCDACFRHVDRRANCPMYKKRTTNTATANSEYSKMLKAAGLDDSNSATHSSVPPLASDMDCSIQPMDIDSSVADHSLNESSGGIVTKEPDLHQPGKLCQVMDCQSESAHSIRRKWFMKMRRQIGRLLNLSPDIGTNGNGMLNICGQHYNEIGHLLVCTLCKRKLVRNHIYYINQVIPKLQELLAAQGLMMTIGQSPIFCKLCRYFSMLLLNPPEKPQKMKFVKDYRRRLLQFSSEAEDFAQDAANKDQAAKPRGSLQANRSEDGGGSADGDEQHSGRDSNASPPLSQIPTTAELLAEYDQSPSITIVPRPKSTTAATPSSSKKQIIVVETGTGHSPIATKEDLSALRANPNISMRELFPGEEDLGLHVNVPFATATSARTPEGWSKCQMTVQYDEQTRQLWEELQKPYGNHSSFMRHLILLEKYFRNGDLVLSGAASGNAVTYAESVQQRLCSYDNKPVPAARTADLGGTSSLAALTSSLFGGKSGDTANVSIIASKASTPKASSAAKSTDASGSLLKPQKLRLSDGSTGSVDKPKDKATAGAVNLPPELICINTNNRPQISIVQSLQQLTAKTGNATAPTASNSSSSPSVSQPSSPTRSTADAGGATRKMPSGGSSTASGKAQRKMASVQKSAAAAADAANRSAAAAAAAASNDTNVIRLPDSLTPEERLESPMWRPTLMPVSAAPAALNGLLYLTADGRKLPNLVQVQSGGNPYLISIFDYNRMCILRRERLMRDQTLQRQQQQNATGQPNSASPPSAHASTSKAANAASAAASKSNRSGGSSAPSAGNKVQIPNKILEQNSLIPLPGAGPKSGGSTNALDSLLKNRKPNPTSLLKQNQNKASAAGGNNIVSITSTPSIEAILGVGAQTANAMQHQQQQMLHNQQMMQNQQIIQQQFLQQQLAYRNMSMNNSDASSGRGPPVVPNVTATLHSGGGPLDALIKAASVPHNNNVSNNNIRMWAEALSRSAAAVAAAGSAGMSGHGSTDNDGSSAASLLSKIPKSLTVIPQQKDGSASHHQRRSGKNPLLGFDGPM